jgi:hypothetical protein
MSLVHNVDHGTTLLDMLMEGHGVSGVTITNEPHTPQERARLYHQNYQKIHESLTTLERSLVKKPSNG